MSPLYVHTFTNGRWKQNAYLVYGEDKKTLIVDPGSDAEGLLKVILDLELHPIAIMNTHAHYDHIGAVFEMQEKFDIPFYLHVEDKKLLAQANLYRIIFDSSKFIKIPKFDQDLGIYKDALMPNFSIYPVHSPGHTEGSVCLQIGNFLFSGDTLLPSGAGRIDLPGGNGEKLSLTLKMLKSLDSGLQVFPGHGKPFFLKDFWSKYDSN